MRIKKQIFIIFLMTLGFCFFSGCAKTEETIKGIYAVEDNSYYAYYVFSEDENNQGTCEWKAFLSQDGQSYQSSAIYEYILEKINTDSYSLHLINIENNNEFEAIYNTSDDTISDDTGTYEKQEMINEKSEIAVLLQGEWSVKMSDLADAIFSFQNGSVSCKVVALGLPVPLNEGTYKIEAAKILITYNNGGDVELEYTYEDGILKLFFNGTEMSSK